MNTTMHAHDEQNCFDIITGIVILIGHVWLHRTWFSCSRCQMNKEMIMHASTVYPAPPTVASTTK